MFFKLAGKLFKGRRKSCEPLFCSWSRVQIYVSWLACNVHNEAESSLLISYFTLYLDLSHGFWGVRYRKILRCAGPPIANPQILQLIRKSQICKFRPNIAQICLKTVLKVVFLNHFYSGQIFLEHYMPNLSGEKVREYVFADLRKLSPRSQERLGPQIGNPKSVTFRKVRKSNIMRICDLRNLFADRSPLLIIL